MWNCRSTRGKWSRVCVPVLERDIFLHHTLTKKKKHFHLFKCVCLRREYESIPNSRRGSKSMVPIRRLYQTGIIAGVCLSTWIACAWKKKGHTAHFFFPNIFLLSDHSILKKKKSLASLYICYLCDFFSFLCLKTECTHERRKPNNNNKNHMDVFFFFFFYEIVIFFWMNEMEFLLHTFFFFWNEK